MLTPTYPKEKNMQVFEGKVCPPGEGKIAIIVARFNRSITEHLLEGALAVLRNNSVPEEAITVVWVPGAFELPTLANRFALDEEYQAVICLGCVIKGETSHDQHINRAVSTELARIGSENGLPVIFGLLTCNTKEQALARSGLAHQSTDKVVDPTVGNKGAEAAEAALEMLHLLEQIPPLPLDELPPDSIIANAADYRQGHFDFAENDGDEFDEDNEDSDDENDFEELDGEEADWFLPGKKSAPKQHREERSGHSPRCDKSGRSDHSDRSSRSGRPDHSDRRSSGSGYKKEGGSYSGKKPGKPGKGKSGPSNKKNK